MARILAAIRGLIWGKEGAAVVEYAVALLLITVITIAAISNLGARISAFFDAASTSI